MPEIDRVLIVGAGTMGLIKGWFYEPQGRGGNI